MRTSTITFLAGTGIRFPGGIFLHIPGRSPDTRNTRQMGRFHMSATHYVSVARHRHAYPILWLTALLLLLTGTTLLAAPVPYFSVQDGAWWDPGTWNPPNVPGDNAVVTVQHRVWASPRTHTLLGLTVTSTGILETPLPGEDVPSDSTGRLSFVVYGTLTNDGIIQASHLPAYSSVANGDVGLVAITGFIRNNGTITAGYGDPTGGSVTLLTWPFGAIWNRGTITAGDGADEGGSVVILGLGILNGDATGATGKVYAGHAENGSGRGGTASLVCPTGEDFPQGFITNYAGSEIVGGNSGIAPGGEAELLAYPEGESGSGYAPAKNYGLIQGGRGCPGGAARFWGDPAENYGTVSAGANRTDCDPEPAPSQAQVDPPTCRIAEAASLAADVINLVAGTRLTIDSLDSAPAINATRYIAIWLAPAGVLDLRNNPAGTDWLMAQDSIAIHADTILTDSGVGLGDIMSPAPIVRAGGRYTYLRAGPGISLRVLRGDTLRLPVYVTNMGNTAEAVDYEITETAGWITAIPRDTVALPPTGGRTHLIVGLVPQSGECVDTIRVCAKTMTPGTPVDAVMTNIYLECRPSDVSSVPDTPGDRRRMGFSLLQSDPNPFSQGTSIGFELPAATRVGIDVFDLQGRLVRRLAGKHYEAGRWSVGWDGRDEAGRPVPAGVYLCRMTAGVFSAQRKMVLTR